MASVRHRSFGSGNLVGASAHVHRRGAKALGCSPRNRAPQSVVHFENSRAVAVFAQSTSVSRRQSARRHSHQLKRSHVAQRDVKLWKRCKILYARRSLNFAAKLRKIAAQRLGERLSPAARNRPADCMCRGPQQNAKRSAQRLIQTQKRMSRKAGEERPRAFAAKQNASKHFRGRKCNQPESCEQPRMSRKQVNRLKNFGRQVRPALNKRLHESAPGPAVITQRRFSFMQIALECNRGAVVKRMRQWTRRMNPLEAVI